MFSSVVISVFAQKTSRTNQIRFVRPHPLMSKTDDFVNRAFASLTVGERVIATFRVTPKNRYYLGYVRVAYPFFSGFLLNNEEKIIRECRRAEEYAEASVPEMLTRCKDFHNKIQAEIEIEKMKVAGSSEMASTVETTSEDTSLFPEVEKISIEDCFVEGIYVDPEMMKVFDTSLKIAESHPVNVLMIGASGYGKTSIPEAIAQKNGMKFYRINCAAVRDPEEWFGYREAKDGDTIFVPSEFTQAVTSGNAVIVLDEFNRVEPWLHNTLYPLLDHARKTVVHGETIACGKNILFVATANIGYQFVGTFMLDSAITNRMDVTVLVEALPEKVEEELLVLRSKIQKSKASAIVSLITSLRKLAQNGKISGDVSTRTSLKVANFVAVGMSIPDAFKFVFINTLTVDEAKIAIDNLSSSSRFSA